MLKVIVCATAIRGDGFERLLRRSYRGAVFKMAELPACVARPAAIPALLDAERRRVASEGNEMIAAIVPGGLAKCFSTVPVGVAVLEEIRSVDFGGTGRLKTVGFLQLKERYVILQEVEGRPLGPARLLVLGDDGRVDRRTGERLALSLGDVEVVHGPDANEVFDGGGRRLAELTAEHRGAAVLLPEWAAAGLVSDGGRPVFVYSKDLQLYRFLQADYALRPLATAN